MVNKPTLEEGVKVVSQPATPANAAMQPTDATDLQMLPLATYKSPSTLTVIYPG
jgi:hypothetical protein